MGTPHKGTLNPNKLENPQKYQGDLEKIIYRSSWEREAMLWADKNPKVIAWASEELFIPYEHPIQGRRARYYPDLWLKMFDGQERVIEIKPKKQTTKPEPPKRKTKNYLNEVSTWVVNNEKWLAARSVCDRNGISFEIWTEDELKEMGLLKSLSERAMDEVHKNKPKMKPIKQSKPRRPRPKRRS